MDYRSLGRTGMQVSPLCLGCMMFGGKTEQEEANRMVARTLDAGINFIDTANAYTEGRSEKITGEAIKLTGKRHRIVLATKVFAPMNEDDPNARGNHRRHLIEQCEESLQRLQTDYIDLYQIHRPMSTIPIDETLRALDDLVRSGKVRYIGSSTFAAWQLVESLWVSKEYGLNRFVCEQPPYNILERRAEREVFTMAQTYGFGIIPWSPLAGGLLTGKYRKGKPLPENARFNEESFAGGKMEAVLDAIEELVKIVEPKGCTLSQFSLAWTLKHPAVSSPIIGPSTMAQLEDNLKALDVEITEEDMKAVDQIAPPGGFIWPRYFADFGPSKFRW